MSLVDPAQLKSRKRSPVVRKVDTPELGDDKYVYVRPLSAAAADKVQEIAASNASKNGQQAIAIPASEARSVVAWCILGICDKQGAALFTDADSKWLMQEPLVLLHRLANAIFEINDIGDDAGSARKKNSKKARSAGSRLISR